MITFEPTITSVEKYLDFLKGAKTKGAGNVPVLNKRTKEEYKNALEKTEFYYFIKSADYHYFISRILFLHHILTYSKFCGYQCVENYLKAYVKYRGEIPPDIHDLQKLLGYCRDNEPVTDSFINSDNISIIIAMYEPFYEIARYPVQHQHPGNFYASLFPNDIYILDYFVMKMREILVIPSNTRDILKDGHFDLFDCQLDFPDFYKTFMEDNINFSDKKI